MKYLCFIGIVIGALSYCLLNFSGFQTSVRADTSSAAAPAPGNSQIQQWITDLNSSQYTVRQQAKQNLIAADDDALDQLRAQLKSPLSPEQATDITAILETINQNDLLRGPLVSLDADNMPAEQAFKTVLDQAKVSYSIWPPQLFSSQYQPISPVTLHAHNAPYWQVIWALYQQTGVSLNYFNNGLQLTNNISLDKHNPIYIHGAFAIALQSIQYHRDVNFNSSNPSVDKSFDVQMLFMAVPDLPIVQSNATDVELTSAMDDKGQSLLLSPSPMSQDQRQYWYNNQTVSQVSVSAGLNRIKGIGTRLADIQGAIPVRIECDKQDLAINDLTKPGQTVAIPGDAGIVISFDGLVRQSPNTYQVKYSITWPVNNNGGDSPEAQQTNFITGQLQSWSGAALLDANGQKLSFQGGGGGGGDGRLSYQYSYGQDNGVGSPAKLVFTVYTKMLDTKIPFEFKDVPLP
ncbi:MAG TPA: hypothetical protein VKJ65_02505 [Phycisphaerae bacterium]|nr:hypothetical protein [Phycisphaerae bacterium]